jgi:hypothetical protein
MPAPNPLCTRKIVDHDGFKPRLQRTPRGKVAQPTVNDSAGVRDGERCSTDRAVMATEPWADRQRRL